MRTVTKTIIRFELPEYLACPKPTEERNLLRDEVRLLVTTSSGQIDHTRFNRLDQYLNPGDVLVVNTSATVPSALPVTLPNGQKGMVHVSSNINAHKWLIEIREVSGNKTIRWKEGEEGMILQLPSSASITLKQRYYKDQQLLDLWYAEFRSNEQPVKYMAVNAHPIKYEKLDAHYPMSYYQTFFSFYPGSSEMPSAGRGFTKTLVDRLLKKGVVFAPILLHTGISSLEENESPYPEYMEIDPVSASIINMAKNQGERIIAVGTTAIRAIETAVNGDGNLVPYQGKTELFINENYTMKIADGLITGFHEPKASHLHILKAVAGFDHIENAYQTAIKADYYWHQFGDLHLILE
jgi:S-adenosylmethionine:tRNA ribosyltransferase-isomerase